MPIQRIERERVPFVRPAYEPETRTLRDLLLMAGQARANAVGRQGQAKAEGLMTLGQIISQGLGSIRQGREREQANAFAAEKQAREDALKVRDQQLREADLLARTQEREQAAAERAQASSYKRGTEVAEEVGYGPMSEPQMESVLQGPAAGRARYIFGPGTAEGPELQPTRAQQRGIETEKAIQAMGGQIGPNGQVIMPPKPAAPVTPESRLSGRELLAYLAQQGNVGAARALEKLDAQKTTGGGAPRPLTQTAEAQIIQRLSGQWGAANKPMKDLDRQVALMDTGMEAVKRGDLAQGAQMVLVTFQKILDPPSVVRESEFMRSAAGQSLINRVQGAYERLTQGGAGVTAMELQKFADLAREAAKAQRNAAGLDRMRARLGKTADRYNIPAELIFDDDSHSSTISGGMVTLVAPDGSEKSVPSDQAEHYISLGAKRKP